ncbi:MAG: nucleoside/nucleotide kinase family protein [Clostridiaceae bacterium]|nr:nucleoside/nucleotide kinase family protein [Clostridiaceae bacterium]
MNIELEVSGFKYEAFFSDKEINDIYIPLLKKLSHIREKKGRRLIIFLAAPPAVGKSTLAIFLEKLSIEIAKITPIQSLSLDGFHYYNEFLKTNKITINEREHALYEIKGMPETYDLQSFMSHVEKLKRKNIKWPIYDRNLHNPVEDIIEVTEDIVLIEGNWLLLNEPGWKDLKAFCDYSIFIEASEDVLKNRLINRKIRGGLSKDQALDFYERTDKKNVLRVMENRLCADLTLEMLESGEIIKR